MNKFNAICNRYPLSVRSSIIIDLLSAIRYPLTILRVHTWHAFAWSSRILTNGRHRIAEKLAKGRSERTADSGKKLK